MTETEDSIDQLEIRVKRTGKGEGVLSFFIDASASVLDLKKKISTELQLTNEDVPTDRQRLIFLGRMLRVDDENLKDARMKTDSVNCIHLTPLPDGARPSNRDEESSDSMSLPGIGLLGGMREGRRWRLESMQAGFHPYAFAIPARVITSVSSTAPPSASAPNEGARTATSTSSASRLNSRREAVQRTTVGRSYSAGPRVRHGPQFDDNVATINLADGPASSSSTSGIVTMLQRSIAASAAVQESSQQLRREALDQLLAYTSRSSGAVTRTSEYQSTTERPTPPPAAPATVRRRVPSRRQMTARTESTPATDTETSSLPSRRRPREASPEPQRLRRSTRRRRGADENNASV